MSDPKSTEKDFSFS